MDEAESLGLVADFKAFVEQLVRIGNVIHDIGFHGFANGAPVDLVGIKPEEGL